MAGAARAPGPRRGAAPRDLHARLRHDELRRRRRLRDGQHAGDAAGDGAARAGARRAARARGVRHRPAGARARADRRGADRRSAADPALHGHPLRRARRPRRRCSRWSTGCPPDAVFSTFAIGRMQLPFAALAPLVGGNVRVGLEDNLYLARGRLATNGRAGRARRDAARGDERPRARAPTRCATSSRCAAMAERPRERVGLLGGGVIGGGWAARFLLERRRRAALRPRPAQAAGGSARCWTTRGARTRG